MVKQTKKRPTSKRKPTKKRPLSRRFVLILVLLLTLIPAGIGLYISQKDQIKAPAKEKLVNDELMNKMKEMLENERKRLMEKKLPTINETKPEVTFVEPKKELLPPEPSVYVEPAEKVSKQAPIEKKILKKEPNGEKPTEVIDYEKSLKVTKKQLPQKKEKGTFTGRPKLSIIIDDVSFAHQVRAIKAIPYAVTPSFLPPTKRHPNSHELANDFSFHMVHLPLEALSHNSPEVNTLKVGLDYKAIKEHIKQIKTQFPKAIYYNNHTGSRFTADEQSMDLLFKVLKEEGLVFVDSRTTADTKAGVMSEKYGTHLYSRDVFLDNSYEPSAIREKLKEAVAIAKRTGEAIAICHPHKNTLSVLAKAKSLLKDVDVVYLKDL